MDGSSNYGPKPGDGGGQQGQQGQQGQVSSMLHTGGRLAETQDWLCLADRGATASTVFQFRTWSRQPISQEESLGAELHP
jgi:hypothetical protein